MKPKVFSVSQSGFAWGTVRIFVIDENGDIIVEVWGETIEQAEYKAQIIKSALNEEAD